MMVLSYKIDSAIEVRKVMRRYREDGLIMLVDSAKDRMYRCKQ